jgi:hypothetical protein
MSNFEGLVTSFIYDSGCPVWGSWGRLIYLRCKEASGIHFDWPQSCPYGQQTSCLDSAFIEDKG